MIPVSRVAQPSALARNASRWLSSLQTALAHLQALQSDPTATKSQIQSAQRSVENARKKYNHRKVKEILRNTMFKHKCAYCESRIGTVDHGDIEHFRPKDTYPHLTFEWSNLLYSCRKCNGAENKGTQFPLDSQGDPLLIDPTDVITNINNHLDFYWDDIAKVTSVYGRDARGQTVEALFDLNGVRGRKELVKDRNEYFEKLLVILGVAQGGDPQAIDILRRACEPDAPYSAFALVHIKPHLP